MSNINTAAVVAFINSTWETTGFDYMPERIMRQFPGIAADEIDQAIDAWEFQDDDELLLLCRRLGREQDGDKAEQLLAKLDKFSFTSGD